MRGGGARVRSTVIVFPGASATSAPATGSGARVVGPLTITPGSAVQTLARDDGWLACRIPQAATLTNTSAQPLVVQVAVAVPEGDGSQQVATLTESFTLAPGATWQLSAPPAGHAWLVTAATRQAVRVATWWAVGLLVVGGGLAAYGTVSLVRDTVRCIRARRARRP